MADIKIDTIENGFLISVNGRTTFCDTPEAICGITSQWVFDEVERVKTVTQAYAKQGSLKTYGDLNPNAPWSSGMDPDLVEKLRKEIHEQAVSKKRPLDEGVIKSFPNT